MEQINPSSAHQRIETQKILREGNQKWAMRCKAMLYSTTSWALQSLYCHRQQSVGVLALKAAGKVSEGVRFPVLGAGPSADFTFT